MCWFNKKKKEENEKQAQEIATLKLQLETLQADFTNFQIEILNKLQIYQEHIKNDKDTEQGDDEVTWNGY